MFNKLVLALTLSIILSLAVGQLAHAQSSGQVRVLCPEAALNVPLYEKVIAQKVKSLIDSTAYKSLRVRVFFRRVGGETDVRSNSFDEVLNGLSLSQLGLTTLASGSLSFDLLCTHVYVARIRVTGTEVGTGARFSSSTDSRVTISSTGEARIISRR